MVFMALGTTRKLVKMQYDCVMHLVSYLKNLMCPHVECNILDKRSVPFASKIVKAHPAFVVSLY